MAPTETVPSVDENGKPEGPAEIAAEKKKKKQTTYAGLALGALGVVVAIYLHGKSQAQSSSLPVGGVTGQLAGSGVDPTNQLAGIGQAISQLGASDAQLQAQLAQQQSNSAAAQKGFQASLDRLAQELTATSSHPGSSALPPVDWTKYPKTEPLGSGLLSLGHWKGKDQISVSGGVPVYAELGGQWQQGFNPATLAAGTPIATLGQFKAYEKAPASAPRPPWANHPQLFGK